jgi:hypothetical protein
MWSKQKTINGMKVKKDGIWESFILDDMWIGNKAIAYAKKKLNICFSYHGKVENMKGKKKHNYNIKLYCCWID